MLAILVAAFPRKVKRDVTGKTSIEPELCTTI